MKLFRHLDISASALTAGRFRMDVIATNIANAESTRTENGEVFRRRQVVFQPIRETGGVKVVRVMEDQVTPTRFVYQPGHPDANPSGYVEFPNVIMVNEMVDLMAATRAYEANITVLNASREIINASLGIGR
ncbi:MAG TPA: flagellar basal body rod protein FlgC [Atribacteraceae bacterium]|nr:flagellar basal body rod protein FlgC [Atribacteraceae bacterium]